MTRSDESDDVIERHGTLPDDGWTWDHTRAAMKRGRELREAKRKV
jgi:hypothetical protein